MVAYELTLDHQGIKTRMQAVAPGIIRITRTRKEYFLQKQSPVVVYDGTTQATIQETPTAAVLTAGSVSVRYTHNSGALTFLDANGQILLREPHRRPCAMEEMPIILNSYDETSTIKEGHSVDGARAWAAPSRSWQDRTGYECKQHFVFDDDESLYGLGSHEEGFGNLRGHSQLLYQHNMKAVVPVLVSTKGWGMLFDMGCMMAFRDDEQGSYLWADLTDELDWYFFYGDGSYAAAMAQYRLLTGEAPMLPKYALGYIQSKERYVNAEEMLAVADEYRRRKVPLDVLVLDWQAWPENQWGWKTFDRKRFPDPTAFIDGLHQRNVKFMLSIWPSMQGDENADRKEMLENGCMLGNRLIYNAFDEKARQLYWKQAKEHLFGHGVDAWWCDCTEPFESDWKGSVKPEPLRRAQLNTDEAKRYLDPTKINLYSLYHSQGIYLGQRSACKEKRVCNLTRSSYAGQHRYATITWSGDVSANWETLRRHVPEGLNFCATGEPYWSTDIGAFFPNGNWDPWFYEGDFDLGVDDLGYRELFVRWAQYATFLPMMRAHGTGTPREIWRFGEKGEPFYDALEKTLRLRYHLIPYLYTLMAQTNRTGMPMLRVPALVFPMDTDLRHIEDEMMLGDALLVKPVTRPMRYLPYGEVYSTPDEAETVVLPKGCGWYSLDGSIHSNGGETVQVHAPLDVIPLFVREGTILPWGARVQCTEELTTAPLELIVYPGADGSFTLYDDAGDGYGYEQDQAAWIDLTWQDAESRLTIGALRGSYAGMPKERELLVRRIGGEVQRITYTGEAIQLSLG